MGAILVSIGPAGIDPLTNAFGSPNAQVRAIAAGVLGNYAVPYLWGAREPSEVDQPARVIVPVLVNQLKDPDAVVRCRAAFSLGRFAREPETVIPALINLLGDADYQPRRDAAHALGSFGQQARVAVEPLATLLKDKIAVVRTSAAKALKQIDPEAATRAGVK